MKTAGRRKSSNILDIRPKDGPGFVAQRAAENDKQYKDSSRLKGMIDRAARSVVKNAKARSEKASQKTSRPPRQKTSRIGKK